jgi:hypothetical protein
MDLITVAQAAAAVLAPVLPYLVKGGEAALKEVGKKTGGAAWELTDWTQKAQQANIITVASGTGAVALGQVSGSTVTITTGGKPGA